MSPRASVRFWIVLMAALVTVGVTASMGIWQLSRAAQKNTLKESIATRGALPPLAGGELLALAAPAEAIHRPVSLRGRWVPGATVFLDNRPMNGRTGFVVLTPLQLTGSDRVVLVQRGWVARDFLDRTRLPDLPTPVDEVAVVGRLAPPPSQLFELGAGAQGAIRQNVDLAQLAAEKQLPMLQGVSVLQTGPEEAGLVRDWPRFVGDAHKHYGYAVQWFAMCAVTAALYLWFQIFLPRSRRRTHGTDPR